jgi:hypothetical protein
LTGCGIGDHRRARECLGGRQHETGLHLIGRDGFAAQVSAQEAGALIPDESGGRAAGHACGHAGAVENEVAGDLLSGRRLDVGSKRNDVGRFGGGERGARVEDGENPVAGGDQIGLDDVIE